MDLWYEDYQFYWDQFAKPVKRHKRPRRCAWCHGIYSHHPTCDELRASWIVKMPWGKHKGRPVRELPASYLEWMARKCTAITEELRLEIERVRPDLSPYLQRLDEE